MSDQTRREHPSTYIVQDRSNQAEMVRLQIQDQMLTINMGGVLPEQPDPTIFQRILDVGCGTGNWLIEVAKTYPHIPVLIGVDVSKSMVNFARTQAEEQQVSDRVRFQVMDALRMLEFPDGYFDLVNQRFGTSYLRIWDWPKILEEYQRVSKQGGVIRITEFDLISESTSPALLRIAELFLQAYSHAGHFFTQEYNGVTSHLAQQMCRHGLQDVRTQLHSVESRAGTTLGKMYYEDMKYAGRTVLPFLRKWTRVPDDYEAIYQQMLIEMQQPDFVATAHMMTAWGIKNDY